MKQVKDFQIKYIDNQEAIGPKEVTHFMKSSFKSMSLKKKFSKK
jgi:hypothetical protein